MVVLLHIIGGGGLTSGQHDPEAVKLVYRRKTKVENNCNMKVLMIPIRTKLQAYFALFRLGILPSFTRPN